MPTFALIIATWTAVSGKPATSDEMIADHLLTQTDCQAYVDAFTPSTNKLPAGLTISTTAYCKKENP
jgi:hypothetical protein